MINIKKGIIPGLHNEERVTPVTIKNAEGVYGEVQLRGTVQVYTTMSDIRSCTTFTDTECTIMYGTNRRRFLQIGGILSVYGRYYQSRQSNPMDTRQIDFACVIYEYEGELYGLINNDHITQTKSLGTLYRQFLRQNGVALKNISYVDTYTINNTFKGSVEYRLEDALPEEQERVSTAFIEQLKADLFEKVNKPKKEKEEECTGLPF